MASFISKSRSIIPSSSNYMAITLRRHRSSRAAATKGELFEIDTSSTKGENEMTLKLFDELIHRIIVKKSTPDWLPFVPGSSFWVPPTPSPSNVVHLVHKISADDNNDADKQQLHDESLSFSSVRGWPSSNYFIKGVRIKMIHSNLAEAAIVASAKSW